MALDYAALAKVLSEASKDPCHQVGAIVFDKFGNIRSTGYNGAPRGVKDRPERYQKPLKQFYISHAEENAIAQAARTGVSLDNCNMLIWGKTPCANCARMIIQAGIKTVYFQQADIRLSNYKDSFEAAFQMFEEADVFVHYIEE